MRTFKQILPILIVLTLILSACGGGGTAKPVEPTQVAPTTAASTAESPASPAVLHFGWLGKPDTLNPAYAFLTESYTVFDLIYTPLTTEAPDGKYGRGMMLLKILSPGGRNDSS